jgi:hypothetical protein
MISRTIRAALVVVAFSLFSVTAGGLRAEEGDPAALAAALKNTTVTLQQGLKASEREGKPISAKFEIEHGQLQLSVYTEKGKDFSEVIVDLKTGAVAKAEKITDAGDLKEAAEQSTAMAKAKQSLLAAADTAAKANAGSQPVGITPALKDGHPTAEVNLMQGTTLKKVAAKLD